jgi:hypothetical protein
MVDRPILFSAPMVRALLDGRKCQTRRLLKPQPFEDGYYEGVIDMTPVRCHDGDVIWRFGANAVGGGAIREQVIETRFQTSDRLWVKERFTVQQVNRFSSMDGRHVNTCIDFDAGPAGYEARQWVKTMEADTPKILQAVKQRKDGTRPLVPGIFLPRIASRLTLTVTDVRVERLQSISEADAIAEGVEITEAVCPPGPLYLDYLNDGGEFGRAVWSYESLWNSLHDKPGERWADNPWICAVDFSVREVNIDA